MKVIKIEEPRVVIVREEGKPPAVLIFNSKRELLAKVSFEGPDRDELVTEYYESKEWLNK